MKEDGDIAGRQEPSLWISVNENTFTTIQKEGNLHEGESRK